MAEIYLFNEVNLSVPSAERRRPARVRRIERLVFGAEVIQNALDDIGLLNAGDDREPAAAAPSSSHDAAGSRSWWETAVVCLPTQVDNQANDRFSGRSKAMARALADLRDLVRELGDSVERTNESLGSTLSYLNGLDERLEQGRIRARAEVLKSGERWPFAEPPNIAPN
jgi:hypothetical protein